MSEQLCDPHSFVSIVSSLSGSISFVIWLVAQLPQLIETYQNKTVDGISPWFFAIWLIGDITSFIGCIFTNQMYFQYVISIYFLFNDIVLCGQYYYYSHIYPKKHHRRHSHPRIPHAGSYGSNVQAVAKTALPAAIIASNVASSDAMSLYLTSNGYESFGLISTKTIGILCAWIGAACYFFARVPQLIKNYERKSTQDLSSFLFACTLCANLTYGISIIVSCEFIYDDINRWKFFMNELPYMIGSAGTIVFDIIYFYQVYIYRDDKFEEGEAAPLLS